MSTGPSAVMATSQPMITASGASFTACSSSFSSFALLTPTEEPALAGFTKTGKPSVSTTFWAICSGRNRSERFTKRYGAMLIPAFSRITWVKALSMQMAEAQVPQPT